MPKFTVKLARETIIRQTHEVVYVEEAMDEESAFMKADSRVSFHPEGDDLPLPPPEQWTHLAADHVLDARVEVVTIVEQED